MVQQHEGKFVVIRDRTFDIDFLVKAVQSESFDSDMFVKAVQSVSADVDFWVAEKSSVSFNADFFVKPIETFTADFFVRSTNTFIEFDEAGDYLKVVVSGLEVARFRSDGSVDLNGVVNENAF